jgi:hypothetical protein
MTNEEMDGQAPYRGCRFLEHPPDPDAEGY